VTARIFFIVLGVLFSAYIIRNTTRRRLLEKESFIWLLTIVVVIILGIFPEILDWTATLLHIQYGPSLLFLVSILVLAALLLRNSMITSSQQNKINSLAHKITLLEDEIHQFKQQKSEKNPAHRDESCNG